ncbi:hypothetical protein [Ruminococcus sp.]|uniref:hypothetical protein n=1 Tax=Ruminococcus sp. TaxID=41978 RepID=UPI0026012CC9|nr:hypothetical protein [Ruminococcus sp.]MCR4639139.1 hypothetical protein [Ruminococcus sp.]
MDKKQLTRKIQRISRISLIAMVAYGALNIFGMFPEKRSYIINTKEHSLFENTIGGIAVIAVIFCVIAGFVTAFMLLNELGRRRTPFTLKISNLLRNLGAYMIIIEIGKIICIFIAAREIRVDLFWFAGLVLYAFSLVFRYGKGLQQQSDETL